MEKETNVWQQECKLSILGGRRGKPIKNWTCRILWKITAKKFIADLFSSFSNGKKQRVSHSFPYFWWKGLNSLFVTFNWHLLLFCFFIISSLKNRNDGAFLLRLVHNSLVLDYGHDTDYRFSIPRLARTFLVVWSQFIWPSVDFSSFLFFFLSRGLA